ncbi:MAG: putative Ig domain-containing protein, partial [Planctomycetota bacterium]
MPKRIFLIAFVAALSWGAPTFAQFRFERGDCNADAAQDLGDSIFLLNFLFTAGGEPDCLDACDFNDDGELNLIDPISQLFYLFTGGPPPPPPHNVCGLDPTMDPLDCQASTTCPPEVNTPPSMTSMPITAAEEGSLYLYDVDAIDPDVTDVITYTLDNAPAGATIDADTGEISWIPTAAQVGMNNFFVVRATDDGTPNLFAQQIFDVIVSDVNFAPTITTTPPLMATELVEYTYLVGATDPDAGDTLDYSLPTKPAGAAIDTNGEVTWTPTTAQMGTFQFVVRVDDDGVPPLFVEQSFMVTVGDVNQPPMITSTAPTMATEGDPLTYIVTAQDPDPGDTLSFSIESGPSGATMTPLSPTSATFTWTPDFTESGMRTFTIRVTDDGVLPQFDEQVFSLMVADVNRPPMITSTAPLSATELTPYEYPVMATDADTGDMLTYSLVTKPSNASIDPNTGLITWIPTLLQAGTHAFIVEVSDDSVTNVLTDQQAFTVVVDDNNQQPVITSTPLLTATELVPYNYDVEAMDADVGDTLSFALITAPAGAGIDSFTGLISWIPTSSQAGDHPFVVQVTDDNLANPLSGLQSFTVTVADGNEAPTITTTAVTTGQEGVPYSYDVDASDPNASDTLTFSLEVFPTGATIDSGTGIISWTPVAVHVGATNNFTVRVTDNGTPTNLFDEQMFVVNVIEANVA